MGTIFKLSEGTNLALHAMMLLAETPERTLDTAAMAERLDVSAHHLSKVMQRLQRGGMVSSTRGPKGGFMLAKKAAAVTLLDIYTVIEGPMEIKACLMNHPVCEHPHCPIGKAIAKSGKEFRNLLKNTKLAEIVKRVAK